MLNGQESREEVLIEILHLIHEDRECALVLLKRECEVSDHLFEVHLHQPGVRAVVGWLDAEVERHASDGESE